MQQFKTYSEKQTKKVAENLAKKITSGVIALIGELGAGKTTFVQGFAKGLGIKDKIISPTFVLIRQHKIPDSKKMLYHLDLYRLEKLSQSEEAEIKEIISDPKNLILIEWGQKLKNILPKAATEVQFEIVDENTRIIMIR